jgi:hypothetical protein
MMGVLRVMKICTSTPFGGEVKPSFPCCKILWHVKELCEYEKRYFIGKILLILCHVPPASPLDDC